MDCDELKRHNYTRFHKRLINHINLFTVDLTSTPLSVNSSRGLKRVIAQCLKSVIITYNNS